MRLEDSLFPPQTFTRAVFIDQDFTSAETEDIQRSLQEWETATHNAIHFEIVPSFNHNFDAILALHQKSLIILNYPANTPMVKNADRAIQEEFNDPTLWINAYYDGDQPTPTIYVVSERILGQEAFISVVEHEIGHSLGLEHNMKEGTLMYPIQDKSARHITPDDVRAFCKLHWCNDQLKKE